MTASPVPGRPRTAARAESRLSRRVIEGIRQAAAPARRDEAVRRAERAIDALDRGDLQVAIDEARRAKALAGRSPTVREMLGLALYEAGEWREALRELQAFRRMSGRLDQNHVIADCYRGMGNPERAVAEAEQGLTAPVATAVRSECAIVGASALADLARYDQALTFVRRVPTRSDVASHSDLRLWYVAGDILARAGRTEEAAREFEKVVRHDPSAFDAAERLAELR